MNSLTFFVILQIADLATTLFFLAIGVKEANPVVRSFLHVFSPVVAMFLVKLIGVALGIIWFMRKSSFKNLNILYSAVVFWNLIAIAVQLSK